MKCSKCGKDMCNGWQLGLRNAQVVGTTICLGCYMDNKKGVIKCKR